MACDLHVTNLGSIPSAIYGPLSTAVVPQKQTMKQAIIKPKLIRKWSLVINYKEKNAGWK